MPLVVELPELVALCGEILAYALLTLTIILLAKLVSIMDHKIDLGIVSFRPLGWLADALRSYVLAGAEDARQAVAGAIRATVDAMTWALGQLLTVSHDIAQLARNALLYLWKQAVQPWVHSIVNPVRALANKAEADVIALGKTVVKDFNLAKEWATNEAHAARDAAEGFTRTEITAARRDLGAAIAKVDNYVHAAEATAEAIPGAVAGDFGSLWDALRKDIRPENLGELLSAGLLSGMLLRLLTQEMGMEDTACRDKVKGVCGTDPLKWAHMLEGLLLMGGVLDFAELLDLCRVVFHEGENLVMSVGD